MKKEARRVSGGHQRRAARAFFVRSHWLIFAIVFETIGTRTAEARRRQNIEEHRVQVRRGPRVSGGRPAACLIVLSAIAVARWRCAGRIGERTANERRTNGRRISLERPLDLLLPDRRHPPADTTQARPHTLDSSLQATTPGIRHTSHPQLASARPTSRHVARSIRLRLRGATESLRSDSPRCGSPCRPLHAAQQVRAL
jgi:hypothetical protein